MFDIRNYALTPTAAIHIRDAEDNLIYADAEKKRPVQIHIYGPGSKQFADAEARNSRRIMEGIGRRGKKSDAAEMRINFLVAITKSFENLEMDKLEGEALYRAVYTETSLRFISDQVHEFVHDTANFTKSSSAN